jgi:hypothetical protein
MKSYVLAKIDGAKLDGTVAGNRLKRFFSRPEKFTVIVLKTKHVTQEDLKFTQKNNDHENT